jgi:hypothetical protein
MDVQQHKVSVNSMQVAAGGSAWQHSRVANVANATV